jgi:hypothetical protein
MKMKPPTRPMSMRMTTCRKRTRRTSKWKVPSMNMEKKNTLRMTPRSHLMVMINHHHNMEFLDAYVELLAKM